ncbi:MAG: hypothetical protein K2X31_11425 [Sphingopyxis sp.]|nr:hypothetical protein [Sphingopyxis sp.]
MTVNRISPAAVSNADLCALMDGECDGTTRERIEAELALSPQCAERLALWRRNDAALRFALVAGAQGASVSPAPVASLPPDPIFAIKTDPCEPRNGHHRFRARERLSGSARAATIAALAGGAGAGAIALAILLLTH